MEEKLLYVQNGVFKRKTPETGLMTYANGSFTSITPSANGLYNIRYEDNAFRLESTAAAGEYLTNSDFKTENNSNLAIAANGTIPVFISNSTFKALDLPLTTNTRKFCVTKDGLTPISTKVSDVTGLKNNVSGIILANNNDFSAITASPGTHLISISEDSSISLAPLNVKSMIGENDGLLYATNNTFNSLKGKDGEYRINFSEGLPSLSPVEYTPSYIFGEAKNGILVGGKDNVTTINTTTNGLYYIEYRDGKYSVTQKTNAISNVLGERHEGLLIGKNNQFHGITANAGKYMINIDTSGNYSLVPLSSEDTSIGTFTPGMMYVNADNEIETLQTKTDGLFNIRMTNGVPGLVETNGSGVIPKSLTYSVTGVTINGSINSNGMSVIGDANVSSDKTYLMNVFFNLNCSNYEELIDEHPLVTVTIGNKEIVRQHIGNPFPYHYINGSNICTSPTGTLAITITITNATNAKFTFASNIQVSLLEI